LQRAGNRIRALPEPVAGIRLHNSVKARYLTLEDWRPGCLKPLFDDLEQGRDAWLQSSISPDARPKPD
jgi:hypothetical protein